jgi:ribulose-phosphate 3-epimerase
MIIPAINAKTLEEAKVQMEKFIGLSTEAKIGAGWIHLDIVDGKFAPNLTWNSPREAGIMKRELKNVSWEIHLMVMNPEAVAEEWLRVGTKRLIVHLESNGNTKNLYELCKKYGAELFLAVGPDGKAEELALGRSVADGFQILTVSPGKAGQAFGEDSLKKIRFLRQKFPDVKIEVDGGINPKTAKLAKDAGADLFVSASYILQADNSNEAYQRLADAIKNF